MVNINLEAPIKKEKKEFSSKLETSEKQAIINIIKANSPSYHGFFKFEQEQLTDISDILNFKYSFKKSPSAVNFKCFAENIWSNFGHGPSSPRELLDFIKLLPDACTAASGAGLSSAVSSGVISAFSGDSALKFAGKIVAHGLLGAFIGGVYNFYSNKALKFDANFDEAVSQCFGPAVSQCFEPEAEKSRTFTHHDKVHKLGEVSEGAFVNDFDGL